MEKYYYWLLFTNMVSAFYGYHLAKNEGLIVEFLTELWHSGWAGKIFISAGIVSLLITILWAYELLTLTD